MKDKIFAQARFAAAVLLAAFALMLPSEGALAQVVTKLPVYVDNTPGLVTDLGNGPLEIRMVGGSAQLFTSSATGVGSTSGSSTTLTLTASAAANPPCVGCVISGTGITAGTTVAAFNGTTTITLSSAMTVASNTALAWGMACPATPSAQAAMLIQAGVGADVPLYTYARVCAASQFANGGTLLPFPIGAH